MAVTFDPDQPLDPDTRQRLLERNRWQEVEENDRRFGSTEQESGDPSSTENGDGDDPDEDEGEEPGDEPDDDPNELLMDELRDELRRREIAFPRKARKPELVSLLRQAEEAEADSGGTE